LKLSIEDSRLNAYVAGEVALTAREAVSRGLAPVIAAMTSLTTSAHVMALVAGPTGASSALRILAEQFEAKAAKDSDENVKFPRNREGEY
jgi:hypothetical protein